jgi:hypothetical protein
MMRSLWYICSLVLLVTSCNCFVCQNIQTENPAKQRAAIHLFDTTQVRKFKTKISYKTTEITGITICKNINDSILTGAFINEFGIKGFDFTGTDKRVKLGYVFKNLDKWYIRKKLESDLHFIFSNPVCSNCVIQDTVACVSTISRSLHYVYYTADKNGHIRANMFKGSHKVASLDQYTDESGKITLKMGYTDGSLEYEFNEITN